MLLGRPRRLLPRVGLPLGLLRGILARILAFEFDSGRDIHAPGWNIPNIRQRFRNVFRRESARNDDVMAVRDQILGFTPIPGLRSSNLAVVTIKGNVNRKWDE